MGKHTRINRRKKILNPVPKNEEECLELIGRSFMASMLHSIGKGDPKNALQVCLEDPAEGLKWCNFLDRFLGQIELEGSQIAWEIENPGPGGRVDPPKELRRCTLLRELAMHLKELISPKEKAAEETLPNVCIPECK